MNITALVSGLYGTPECANGGSLTPVPPVGFLSNSATVSVLSCYILFCYVLLLSLRSLLFSNERKRESQDWRGGGRNWEEQREGN